MVSEEQAKQDTDSQQNENTPSPGAMLKARREALNLTQQDVADKLFLKVQQINDVENDKLDENVSITFTKGYVRNYAKQVNLNAQDVTDAFERFHSQNSLASSENLQSFSKRVAKQTHDDRWMMVTYVILLLIVAGIVAWWYQQPSDGVVNNASLSDAVLEEPSNTINAENSPVRATSQDRTETIVEATSTSSNALVQPLQQDKPREQNNGLAQRGSTQTSQTDANATTAPDSVTDERDSATELDASSTELTEGQALGDAASISMIFTFNDDCWVNITDATGEAIAYGVKRKGRIMEIRGVAPVEVTLGAPDNVVISVNGDAVDISSYQNGRTARFTLPM